MSSAKKITKYVQATQLGFYGGRRRVGAKFYMVLLEGQKLPSWVKEIPMPGAVPQTAAPAAAPSSEGGGRGGRGNRSAKNAPPAAAPEQPAPEKSEQSEEQAAPAGGDAPEAGATDDDLPAGTGGQDVL